MRRRTKRDMGILLGALVILGGVVFFNMTLNRTVLADKMGKWRNAAEQERVASGMRLLNWKLMWSTKGSLRKGGVFAEELLDYHDRTVNLMGFMVPQEQFRDVTEFLLLPLPIECYFCQIPPARDVMLIQLAEGETAAIFEEPVLISGVLQVHQEAETKFFYSITNAKFGPGEMGATLTKRRLKIQHMLPQHENDPGDLLPAYTPPSGDTD